MENMLRKLLRTHWELKRNKVRTRWEQGKNEKNHLPPLPQKVKRKKSKAPCACLGLPI